MSYVTRRDASPAEGRNVLERSPKDWRYPNPTCKVLTMASTSAPTRLVTAAAVGGLLASGMFVGSAQAYPVNDPQVTTNAVGYGLGHNIIIHIANLNGPVKYKTWLIRVAPCVGNWLPISQRTKFFYGQKTVPAGVHNARRSITAPRKSKDRGRYQVRIETYSMGGAALYQTNTNISIGC